VLPLAPTSRESTEPFPAFAGREQASQLERVPPLHGLCAAARRASGPVPVPPRAKTAAQEDCAR
jgi:hypothetical protein